MFFLHLLIFVLVGLSVAQENNGDDDRYECGPCDKSACPRPTELACHAMGLTLVPDRCSCCMVCPKVLGERCGGPENVDGRCSDDYICAGKSVYEPVKNGQIGQCVCKTFDIVCGTDGVVYNNYCELMMKSYEQVKKGEPAVGVDETDELCVTVPIIRVAPKDSSLEVDSQSELSCEALGRPVPDIIWTKDGEELPGNHINIATRKRNGPTKFGMTSWVLILVSPEDDGSYTCTAKNSQGEVSATAIVQVINSNQAVDRDDNVVPIEL